MPHFVYILYSQSADRFYIGETCDVSERLSQHNSGFYKNSFTKQATDWAVFFTIECHSRKQAIEIEIFISKSKKIRTLSMNYFKNFQFENLCVPGSPEVSGPSGTTKRGNASFSSLFLR